MNLIGNIVKRMESGQTPCSLYTDLSKCYSTLSRDIWLTNLNCYGYTGTKLKLLTRYLVNLKRYVNYKSCQSDTVDITAGVLQGSILGQLLFSIYIKDLIL